MGYIYIMLEVDENGAERHKIGVTKNDPRIRRGNLQTGNSDKIDVLKVYESVNYLRIEKWLHRKYQSKQTLAENEWFKLDDESVLNFERDCKQIDETIELLKRDNPYYN